MPRRQAITAQKRHQTLPHDIHPVPGYPQKLVIYRLDASPYWWARYYLGRTIRRSTRTADKGAAFKFARAFYDELNFHRYSGQAIPTPAQFETCVAAIKQDQAAQVRRGALSAVSEQAANYRFDRHILPFFRDRTLQEVDFRCLQEFLNYLSDLPSAMKGATIRQYMHLVRKTLLYAQRMDFIKQLPQFPKVAAPDNARGYFTAAEYLRLWRTAKANVGRVFEVRMVPDGEGGERAICLEAGRTSAGRLLRNVEITADVLHMIPFVTNSFIRPTDLKHLQHKHVDVVSGARRYLRLRLPTSKRHSTPIVTMPAAVRVRRPPSFE